MKEKRSFLNKLFKVLDGIHLVISIFGGIAGAVLLGHYFNMGLSGYALGFFGGFGIIFGVISLN